MSEGKKILKPREKKFCQEYVRNGGKGKEAAEFAGYSKKTATEQASQLLTRLHLQEYIATLTQKIEDKVVERCVITKEWVRARLKELVERCMQRTPVMKYDYKEKQLVQVTEFNDKGEEVGVWLFDSRGASKALELLGKELKMFSDSFKIEITEDIAKVIEEARRRAANAHKKHST